MSAARPGKGYGKRLPAPRWSSLLYIRVQPAHTGMVRFLLETEDGLGIMSVVDRWGAVLQLRFSPHMEREMRAFLDNLRRTVPFEELRGSP